jgi:hypothetical protein
VEHSRSCQGRQIAYWICRKPLLRKQFLAKWQDLAEQRIVRIAALHAADELARRKEGKSGSRFLTCFQPLVCKSKQIQKLSRIAYRGSHGRLPRLRQGNVPYARRRRSGADRLASDGYNAHLPTITNGNSQSK